MKVKPLILGLGLGALLATGCNDDLSLVGPSIQPPEDAITVYNDTFHIQMSTVLMDGVYAKADSAVLGEIYDPLYGDLKSDYICQLYCPEEYQFAHEPIDGKIDSVTFDIVYYSALGDTLTPMRASVYAVTEQLERNFYTNFDPAKYCDLQQPLGQKTYTAYDQTVSDSIRNLTSYSPNIVVRLPVELGQRFYDETVNNPSTFSSQENFNQFMPGFYVTTDFGTGCLLNVAKSYFCMFYKYKTTGSAGQDTIVHARELFNATQEVIQLSRFKNTDMSTLLIPNEEYTYLKSPAGVCTRLTLPVEEMAPRLEGRILNNLPLTLYAMPQENWQYAFEAAPDLLILPEDSVKNFFETNQIEYSNTSYVAQYVSSTLSYSFGNISNLLKDQLANGDKKDVNLLVIPIKRQVTTTGSYYYTSTVTSSIGNYMSPSGTKLRKDGDKTQIIVTSCRYQ